jgi:CRP-like cAMP-binding protein
MTADRKAEALQQVDLFRRCTKKELRAVAALCTALTVDEGFVLTTQGGPGHECFVIGAGQASAYIDGEPIATVGPSEVIGEMSLLDGGVRTATVTATTPMTLYVMSPREFQALLHDNPAIALKVMTTLARRLRAAETG